MEILGIRVDNVSMEEAVKRAEEFLNTDKLHMIFTPNPEIIIQSYDVCDVKNIFNSSDLSIPDGNGIVWAGKRMGFDIKERVAGFDFIHELFEIGNNKDVKFFFLGSRPGIALKAKENLESKYENIKITGVHDGYFSKDEEESIVEDINKSGADVLLVALGAPKQEKFIYEHKEKLKCKIAIGVGGCFDVISGEVKRAPKLFIKLKLEWLYRGLSDIRRIKRLLNLPKFALKVMSCKKGT